MNRLRLLLPLLGALTAGMLSAQEPFIPSGPPVRSGRVPNALMDQHVEEPIRRAQSAFDVYQVLVDWVLRAYPGSTRANQAARQFRTAILGARAAVQSQGRARVTVEMPMAIDEFLRHLRQEAPGIQGRELPKGIQSNGKARLFTAALLPLLHLRGIAYRIRPLVERSFVMHTGAISWLRMTYNDVNTHHPPNQRALFQFFTYPMAEKGPGKVQFHSFSDLQDWVAREFLPTWNVGIELASKTLEELRPDFKESLDLAVFHRGERLYPMESVEMRDRVLDRTDVEAMVAYMYAVRSTLRTLLLYKLDDYPDATNALNKELIEGFFAEKVPFGSAPRKGFPSKDRYAVLNRFADLYTIRDASQGKEILEDLRSCWTHADRAVRGYLAHREPEERDSRMVNVRALKAWEQDYTTKLSPQLSALLGGPATLTDYVGGATIDIDLPGLLTSPPRDLKAFFPTRFEEGREYRTFEFSSGKLNYANYQFGNPVSWAAAPWQKLFPNLVGPMSPDVNWDGPLRAYRDVTRTYLGGWLGPALTLFVN